MDVQGPNVGEKGQQRREDNNEVILAPLASPENFKKVQMDQIETGPVDYVVKCTEGLFAGRFIYVNRTQQGELFGSDKGSEDVTMYIENAKLSPKHAEIKFNCQTYQYFLRDSASVDGTWVRIRWNRSIEVAADQELKFGNTIVEISEGPSIPKEEEVRHWLKAYFLEHLAQRFAEQGLLSLQHVREHSDILEFVARLDLPAEEKSALQSALDELPKMWPASGYPSNYLEFKVRSTTGEASNRVAMVAWEGGTLTLAPNGEAEEEFKDESDTARRSPTELRAGVVPVSGWDKCEWLRVCFSSGKYHIHLSDRSTDSSQKCWVRLRTAQCHWLQPHDVFHIGTLEFQVLRFNAAVYSEQGLRATMEDEDILLQDFATSNWRHCSYFAIYDGHGGRDCVSFVKQHLHVNVCMALHARGGLDKSSQVHHDIFESLTAGFQETDRQFLKMSQALEGLNGGSGCAAVVACVIGGWVWCANVGDSRAILCRDGRAVQLSLDHKPDREDEAKRIESAGGFVSFRRVLGRLAVSRAFGDEEYKVQLDSANGKQLVVADPEIRVERLTPQDEFLFMACDGLFDVFSSQEAVNFIHSRLSAMPSNEQDPQRAVQDIVHEAIQDRGSRDNVTALLVTFRRSITPRR